MTSQDIAAVAREHTGLSHLVLEYGATVKRLVDEAKEPGFSAASWAALADMVAVAEFERIGNFKEVMNWDQYIEFLTGWAKSAEWEGSFKRITEHRNVVFLELEERSKVGNFSSVVNSMSVYEFDDAGLIRHIDVYLQMALPSNDMLGSYEGIDIS